MQGVGALVQGRCQQCGDDEREDHRAVQTVGDVAELHAQKGDDQAELGNLGQTGRSDRRVAPVETAHVEQRQEHDVAGEQRQRCEQHGEHEHIDGLRHRNSHAQADEEERHEEVLDDADLGNDLRGVWQARDTRAGDQRAHAGAHRQMEVESEDGLGESIDVDAEEHDEKTP